MAAGPSVQSLSRSAAVLSFQSKLSMHNIKVRKSATDLLDVFIDHVSGSQMEACKGFTSTVPGDGMKRDPDMD